MNDQQIYMLVAKTPDIRAVQIADALDKDLFDVSEALRPLVEVGDLVRHAGKSPNGHPAQLYNLSPAFRASKEGQAILAMVATPAAPVLAEATPTPAPAPLPAPATAPVSAQHASGAPLAIPVFTHASNKAPKPKPAERAASGVAFIASAQRPVNQDELRLVMSLNKAQYPGTFLKDAIEQGLIHRDGAMFMAGPAPEACTGPSAKDERRDTVLSIDGNVSAPQVAAAPQQGLFRCGLWSDGTLELQRNGEMVAELARGEGEHLVSFFSRMLANPMGTDVQTSAPMAGSKP